MRKTQAAQASVTGLATESSLARRIGDERAAADHAALSIAVHAAIRNKLRDAAEALRDGNSQAAADRLLDATGKLEATRNDPEHNELKNTLKGGLDKLLKERGHLGPPPEEGWPARDPRIVVLIAQLKTDFDHYDELDKDDRLRSERDLFIADVWTENVERRLNAAPPRYGYRELAGSLLDALYRNPKSDEVQILLDLVCAETTPAEIADSLARGEAWVECIDHNPRAMQPVGFRFELTHPALRAVPAAYRLLEYVWAIDDNQPPPPNVRHFRRDFGLSWRDAVARRRTAGLVSYDVLAKRKSCRDGCG